MGGVKASRVVPAAIPVRISEHELDDSVSIVTSNVDADPTCAGIWVHVTTAGLLSLEDQFGNVVNISLPIGFHDIRGNFRRVRSTGTTAVLSPPTTVFPYFWS